MTSREDQSPLAAPLHRRALLRSAWAAPVVLVAVAAPAAAATPIFTPSVGITLQRFDAGPGGIQIVVIAQTQQGPTPLSVPFAVEASADGITWTFVASGSTSNGGGSTVLQASALTAYTQLRVYADISGTLYYSGGASIPF